MAPYFPPYPGYQTIMRICTGATQYRFTVVAFDDKARFVRKVVTIKS
jgi:hypothetical protein